MHRRRADAVCVSTMMGRASSLAGVCAVYFLKRRIPDGFSVARPDTKQARQLVAVAPISEVH